LRTLKFAIAVVFVIVISAIAFSPYTILNTTLPGEAWLVSSAKEMHEHFSIVPKLGGIVLEGQNPLSIMLYALADGDMFLSRYISLGLGIFLALSVLIFAGYIWGTKTGLAASVLTSASLGAISVFGKVDPSALPLAMSSAGFMLFSAVYLKKLNKGLYLAAYLMACLSIITGGYVYLFFFLMSALLLILLDLSPQEILKAKPLAAILILIGGFAAFYAVMRIAGGSAFMKGALSQGRDIGFFRALWLTAKSTLPWMPLIVPAWIYSAKPSEYTMWREYLPPKIAIASSLLIAWGSDRCLDAFCVLAVPFGSMLVAAWALKATSKIANQSRIVFAAMFFIPIFILVIPLAYLLKLPFASLSFIPGDSIIVLCILTASGMIAYFAFKKKINPAIISIVAVMLFISWLRPFYDTRLNNPDNIIAMCSSHYPLLVYDDDLVMRGKLAGINPVVVSRCYVPVDNEAYIAVSSKSTKKLIKELSGRMSAELEIKQALDREYALVKVRPKSSASN
jgi:hypothetical protein